VPTGMVLRNAADAIGRTEVLVLTAGAGMGVDSVRKNPKRTAMFQ
jgi:hypothetical protein